MESDERFKHLASDPRFKAVRKKQQEPKVDERFQSMFTDEKYKLISDRDKRESESGSEVSSSSDESDSDLELEGDVNDRPDIDADNIKFDWKPLDADAEKAEASSCRLAIQNLDWDHLNVKDVYILVNSVRPPLSVKMYISGFGKERLAKEEKEGPPELTEMAKVDEEEEECKQLEEKMRAINERVYKPNEYEDADEVISRDEEVRERIRIYQLNRMKYYYAIVEFDSVESAEQVYQALDGMEYEGSSLELDLRFVPDDMEFDICDIKAECNKLPDPYKPPTFINTALQQTTVKFTWDETDARRQEQLRKAHTKEELEKGDLEAYLASSSSEDEEVSEGDENVEKKSSDKYKELLKSLGEEEDAKNKKVDIEWDNENDSSDHAETLTPIRKKKSKRNHDKEQKPVSNDDRDDLDLLVMDAKLEDNLKEFEFNPDDQRFKAIYESAQYNIDPSHPNFKRTQAFDLIAQRKRTKRRH